MHKKGRLAFLRCARASRQFESRLRGVREQESQKEQQARGAEEEQGAVVRSSSDALPGHTLDFLVTPPPCASPGPGEGGLTRFPEDLGRGPEKEGFDKISRKFEGQKREPTTFFARFAREFSSFFRPKIRVFSNFLPHATRAKIVFFAFSARNAVFFTFLVRSVRRKCAFLVIVHLKIRFSRIFLGYTCGRNCIFTRCFFAFCL